MRWNALPKAADLKALLRLAAPLVVVQVGAMMMGVVDTVMVGRLSADALAAVAVANIYYFTVTMFGLGALLALDPIISQALGAKDFVGVARGLQRGLVLSAVLAVPITAVLACVEPVLAAVRQPSELLPTASGYVYRVLPSVWPFYAFIVLRQTLQAHRRTAPIVVTIGAANVLNAVLNYAWIYGELGFPELGALGSAWATTVSRWCMALFLLLAGWSELRRYLQSLAPDVFAPRSLLRMLRVGAPIGAQMVLEVGAFSAVAFLMGSLGLVQVAAHQVAINLASLTFMVPLGVASAAAVIVGHAVGRGDPAALRRASVAALLVGAGFMACTAALFIGVPRALAQIYTTDAAVLGLAVVLLPIAGVFQVFDGLQVVAIGVLRGLGDTQVPMIVNILGFWCIGMPISLWLGFGLDMGAEGLWWGLVVGLMIVAVFLIARVAQRARGSVARLSIDEPVESNALPK
jgi:MATE family multidrug resistance protein